jgi:hypothetical protein
MQQTFGAVCALAVLGLLLIGPLVMAINASHHSPVARSKCVAEMGCDPVTMGRTRPPVDDNVRS